MRTSHTLPKSLAAAVLVLSGANCYALDPARTVSQYVRESWGLRDGIPRGEISGIAQSADGYLWIGTEQGPLRFDGLTFIPLADPGTASYALDHVFGLLSDRDGGLWVRLPDPTLLRYRNGEFVAMRFSPRHDAFVTAMTATPKGSLLFASLLDGVFTWRRSRFETLIAAAVLPTSPITSIAATANGDVWLGTRDAGLFRLRGTVLLPIANGLPDLKINCLLAGAENEVYVGTDRGLVRWDGTRLTGAGVPKSLSETPILAMARDRDANIWIGAGRGLLRLNDRGASSFGEADSGKAITALFEDREGDLWAAGSNELERIQDGAFVAYQAGRMAGPAGPIYADLQGRIWTAPTSGGLYYLEDRDAREVALPDLGHDEVYSIAGGGDDLWLGSRKHGLTHLTTGDTSKISRTYTQKDGLPQDSVYVVHQNHDGTVWSGTLTGGASHFRQGKFYNYTTANGLVSNTILSIAEGADGTMWFAAPSGLNSFAKDQWRTYGVREGLPSVNVNTLFKDSSNILWLGTLRGLAFIRSGRVFVPSGLPPPLLGQIFGIAQDRNGSLWVSTSTGVLRVDRARLLSGQLTSQDVREFGLSDGLLDADGVRRETSISTDPSGRVWLSTVRGIVAVDPDRLRRTAVPTIVHVDQILADGELQDARRSVSLRPGSKRITIEYAGLNLASPGQVRYRFRLDGFDSNWSPPALGKEAAYTNLGPGTYTFHVIASNADQVWSGTEAKLSFSVIPALWQTWWFRSAALVSLILAMIVLYRLRLRQVTEQVNNRFEARLLERARIARDLHDTLLQSFHGLMLRFQAVRNLLPDQPSQAKHSLEIAIDRAALAITEGRDAVQELRSSESGRDDLIGNLTLLGQEFAALADSNGSPSFRVLMEGTPRQLHPSLQEDLYRIAREAVVNAFRHAHASRIELDLRYDARMLLLRVRDDGLGMDPAILTRGGRDGHWGLRGMQERAKAIRGRLEIWSESRRGTEIELKVPAIIAYSESKSRLPML